jgi:hypothetical protein
VQKVQIWKVFYQRFRQFNNATCVQRTTPKHGYCAVFYASRKINEVVLFIFFNARLISRITEFKKRKITKFADRAKISNI